MVQRRVGSRVEERRGSNAQARIPISTINNRLEDVKNEDKGKKGEREYIHYKADG